MPSDTFWSDLPAEASIAPLHDGRNRFPADGAVMMWADSSAPSREVWGALAEHVSAKGQPSLRQEHCERELAIACLRETPAPARRESESRGRFKASCRADAWRRTAEHWICVYTLYLSCRYDNDQRKSCPQYNRQIYNFCYHVSLCC